MIPSLRESSTPDGATTGIASVLVLGIASVLVLGAATVDALLLIARYREELRGTDDRFAAGPTALRRTSEAILAGGGPPGSVPGAACSTRCGHPAAAVFAVLGVIRLITLAQTGSSSASDRGPPPLRRP